MKVTPIGNHVLLECLDGLGPAEKQKSPSHARAKNLPGNNFGVVVAVGVGVNLHKGVTPEIKAGDVVTYGKSVDGQGYEDEGKQYKLVHCCEVFAKVER